MSLIDQKFAGRSHLITRIPDLGRRGRIPSGCWKVVLAVLFMVAVPACRKSSDESPGNIRNVLFIMGDDHSASVYGAYGNNLVRTPFLDALASQGVRFDHAYANSPVCTPSRQSIITGKLPHAAGVTLLQTALSKDQETIAEHLKKFGFRTGAVGKMHFNSSLDHGFDYRISRDDHQAWIESIGRMPPAEATRVRPAWRPFRDPARVWLNADVLPGPYVDEQSEGTYFAGKAMEFLRQFSSERFCLWVSFHEPHSPFNFPVEFSGRYRPEEMPLPPVGEEDERWVPSVFKDLTEEDRRGIVASYYTSVEYLDRNVGIVLQELQRLGLQKSTLVIYVGDQGYLLGHHGRFEKHTMWEEAVRAPLVIAGPGIHPGMRKALVEFVDLVPTILDLLGIPPMSGQQGMSLAHVLQGHTDEHRESVFSEYLPDNKAMLRTRRWKYIFTSGRHDLALGYATGQPPAGIQHRLYDLENDPQEFHNLADRPDMEETVHSLQQLLLKRFEETDPRASRLPQDLDVSQALAWFCDPPEGD